MAKPKTTTICWDWKSCPEEDELREALEPLGVFVTEHPAFDGTDMFGYIFSKKKLSKEELEKVYREEFPERFEG